MNRAANYVIAAAACCSSLAAQSAPAQAAAPRFGDPLPGLIPAEFERFRVGLDDFVEVETAEEGLGPAFNAASCAVCHNVPAIGGTSLVSEVRAAYRDESGQIHKLTAPDGTELDTLYHLFSNPPHGCQPVMPPEANIIARRVPIPVFGAGLVEAIADETLVGARRSRRSERRRHQRPRGARRRRRHRRRCASDGSAGRRSTRRCARSAPTRIGTRWGSPTNCFRRKPRRASRRRT